MTDAERRLWRCLRMRQIDGGRFRRQHPVGPYILDFVCLERRLIVEVDGGQHQESVHDAHRDAYLRTQGFAVLRFWNHEVLAQTEAVLQVIHDTLAQQRPHPNLPPQAGEGDQRAGSPLHATAPNLPLQAGEGDQRVDFSPPPQAGEGQGGG
ncbi:MAG: endonuclease domain-containing protein [Proteobacteria bacterium]|nr:endonuclease domain-containing protein [Pseudomonadota bacterium]MBS0463512.1 endonuclease domain-containing protein [Pseudomonadota bacterium]